MVTIDGLNLVIHIIELSDEVVEVIMQMAVYAAVLRAVFPGRRVEAALVWTDGPRLMPVPEAAMRDALQLLTRPPPNFS